MAAKEKCSSRWSAWLAPILLLLAALPASALTARATETRAWEKTSAPPDSRPVESLQLLNLHQQNATVGYDSVLGSPLAAESAVDGEATISQSAYPETAQHIQDAQAAGQPSILTIDRAGAAANRAESLQGIPKVPGMQLDEYPPAMFEEGGAGASVRPISPSDNMGAGASMGNQLRPFPNGAKIRIVVGE